MKHTQLPKLILSAGLVLATQLLHAQDDPDLIAYEGFDYPAESALEFTAGGFGWGGPWGFRNSIDGKGSSVWGAAWIEAGSLSYENVVTAGNHLHLYGDFGTLEMGRRIASVIPGADGTRTYYSFLGQRVGPAADPTSSVYNVTNPDTQEVTLDYPWDDNLYPRGAAWRLFNQSNGEVLQIGNASNRDYDLWSFSAQGLDKTEAAKSSTSFSADVAFVVVRIDHHGDNTVPDDFYMWVNPDLSMPDDVSSAEVAMVGMYEPGTQTEANPNGKAYDLSNIAWISPFAGNEELRNEMLYRPHAEMLMDELRIGRTWASVVPLSGVVEPVDPDPGYYTDDVLGSYYYFGSGWSLWMVIDEDNDWGVIYIAEREEDSAGWVHHQQQGWLYFMDGSPSDGGVFAYSAELEHWIYAWDEIGGNQFYSYSSETFELWVP